ncbi:MAG: 50S ribosome-binding GTPase [Desulfotomaculaceae bacterium]|nr:50S ribosome-binding GTPase [Desulfotomaculaceae bacterium]
MNEQDSVSIAVWTAKSKKLLKNVRQLLNKIGYNESGMPQDVFEGNKPVSLVFAGQYSAGKSSILKALTGIEGIAIGAGITTQEAHPYDWNGIKVIDTPGIHTTLRPDHDEISYLAIANADMLVYVVTHELFDDFIGQNFRKLLLEKDKAGEMILIVNKMADIGNTIENQETKLKDLEKVTTPYTPAQLRTVFADAESYLDSLSESDIEIAEELRERSNYDTLVATLNAFVQDKGISSRMTTVLYRLFEFLQKAVLEYQPSTGDSDIDALEEHLLQQRHFTVNTQWRIETAVKSIFEDAASQIRDKGREVANSIYNFDNEADANEAINVAYNEVDTITTTCVDRVTSIITNLSKNYQAQLDEFYKSDFSKVLKFRMESKYKKGNPLIERLFKSDVLAQGSSKIIVNTAGPNAAASGLKAFSGSNIHQMVLDIGHIFGHSFKPWEAVKLVRGINVAGKVLGVFGVVFSLGMQAKEDVDADKRQQEMRKNREELRAGFNNAANEVVKYFNNALVDFLDKNYLTRIAEIDSQISEIRNMRIGKSETCKLLESAQTDCRLLISDIHQSYSDNDDVCD